MFGKSPMQGSSRLVLTVVSSRHESATNSLSLSRSQQKKKDNDNVEEAEDDWGGGWELLPGGTEDTDKPWGREFKNPYVGDQAGDFRTPPT